MAKSLSELLKENGSEHLSKTISPALDMCLYPDSMTVADDTIFAMALKDAEKLLIVLFDDNEGKAADFTGPRSSISVQDTRANVRICFLTHENALAVRQHLPFTAPITLGVKKTIGTGDRLGIATPGHIMAVRTGSMRPVLAQQSIREMTRTQRTAQEVIDDACWGVLQTGYRDGYGADADHLKNTNDIDTCIRAGFVFFTVDPGDHVNPGADRAPVDELKDRFDALPWDVLCCGPGDCIAAYAGKNFSLPAADGGFTLTISNEDLLRAAIKYGRAIAHVATMYTYLKEHFRRGNFEFEVSVDETDAPTSIAEHYYIASELKRLGIQWVSLAPRFVGEFEKGVDYIGDLGRFRADFAKHVAIAGLFGPYKISLHSGSDKFSIYPIIAELAGDLIHLKTAGTSYLEALRTIAYVDARLFREILVFAKQRYTRDRATYHVSANIEKMANPDNLKDAELPNVLDRFDTREACHVTFGSVLTSKTANGSFLFRDRFFTTLRENETIYYQILEKHIGRHIKPFS